MELKNKVVLITGSSTGIGKATALKFAKEGAKIVVNYHKTKSYGEETLREVKKLGVEAILVKADISKVKDVQKLFKETLKRFKKIDILVNNAAIPNDKFHFLKISHERIVEIVNTDLIGVITCSQEAFKIMKKQGYGKILNTSSVRGLEYMGTAGTAVYSATKAGVNSFTKTLAKVAGPEIQVNAVGPGYVKTRNYDHLTKKELKGRTDQTILKRFITTEEIADAFIFLAKNDAMTGQILYVDGGLTIR